jgi:PhnB protein
VPNFPARLSYRAAARSSDYARAVELGATLQRPAADQFYGDRDGYIIDPFGHGWTVASHVEDVPPEELGRRMAELFG